VVIETVRYYERIGLIPPAQVAGGRRVFDTDDVQRLSLHSQGWAAGFSTDEIRSLLDVAKGAQL
jgi:DNA-binding transcriptional MerR regulator